MKKFVISIIMLCLIIIFVTLNTLKINSQVNMLNDILKKAEMKNGTETMEVINQYEELYNKNKKYFEFITEQSQIEELDNCLLELKGFCMEEAKDDITSCLLRLEHYTNALAKNEKFDIYAIF